MPAVQFTVDAPSPIGRPLILVVEMTSEELARSIVARLRAAGHQAYLVGGCVRDLLLGRAPKDFDVATDARPDRVTELFERSEQVGAHFGVVLVRENTRRWKSPLFAAMPDYSDGRRPDAVRFETDPRQDVLRRDFTINACCWTPIPTRCWISPAGRRTCAAG